MADGGGSGDDGVRVPRWVLVGGLALVCVALGALGALALAGGSDSNAKSVNAGATAPDSSTSTSVPASLGASGATTKTASKSSTPTTEPKPVFTMAKVEPTTVICDSSTDTPQLTVSWTAEHADFVEISGLVSGGIASSSADASVYACQDTSLFLWADGPGGRSKDVYVTWRQITSSEALKLGPHP